MRQLRRRLPIARRLARHEGGLAAVEFSLILPILVVLWIGGVEVTQALSIDRRLNNLASSIGDLVSRTKQLKHDEIDAIFDIAPGAMYPYCGEPHTLAACLSSGLSMRVTAVNVDEDGNATAAWTRTSGTPPTQGSLNTIIPETLRTGTEEGTHIIMAEVYDTYTPAVGYVVTGTLSLTDRMFLVPRLSAKVKLCDNSDQNCQS